MANETALRLLGNELMHAGVDQQRLDGIQLLEQHRITAQTELPPMQFLFRLFGKPCFPRGELVALSGKPKAGKTFVSSMLMSLCFRTEALNIQRMDDHPLRYVVDDHGFPQQAAAVQPTPAIPGDAQPEFDFSSPPPGEAPF